MKLNIIGKPTIIDCTERNEDENSIFYSDLIERNCEMNTFLEEDFEVELTVPAYNPEYPENIYWECPEEEMETPYVKVTLEDPTYGTDPKHIHYHGPEDRIQVHHFCLRCARKVGLLPPELELVADIDFPEPDYVQDDTDRELEAQDETLRLFAANRVLDSIEQIDREIHSLDMMELRESVYVLTSILSHAVIKNAEWTRETELFQGARGDRTLVLEALDGVLSSVEDLMTDTRKGNCNNWLQEHGKREKA